VLLEPPDVAVAAEEPEEFVGDGLPVHPLGGDEREALGEVEAELAAEHTARAGSGAVAFGGAVLERVAQEVFVRGGDRRIHPLDRTASDRHRARPIVRCRDGCARTRVVERSGSDGDSG